MRPTDLWPLQRIGLTSFEFTPLACSKCGPSSLSSPLPPAKAITRPLQATHRNRFPRFDSGVRLRIFRASSIEISSPS